MCAEFGLEEPEGDDLESIEVTGVSSDHQHVESGDIFVAIPGERTHGANFVADAVESGAVAVLTDPAGRVVAAEASVPVLVVDDPRLALGHVARWVYRTDPEAPRLFGVAGSVGKTSVTFLIADLFERLGVAAGLSSSAGRRTGESRVASTLTTPEADDLHALIARMREVGERVAAIEISSHALGGERLAGLEFEVVGPLNFAADRHDAEAFVEAERDLVDPELARRAVINVDSEAGRRLVEAARIPVATLSSQPDSDADWIVEWHSDDQGTRFEVRGHDDRVVRSHTTKPGALAALNAASAIVMVVEGGWATEQIQDALDRTDGFDVRIPGRLERVAARDGAPAVYIDGDDSAAAVRTALTSLRAHTPGRLSIVVGDGQAFGADAASVAHELADRVLVGGGDEPATAQALQQALADADADDTVLFLEARADALRHLDDDKITDPTLELARDALSDAGW
jgi:UDP-N-acetylmuramoyl-L-alanyl-D-glutamate--2,6-diaminopimelate ligase